MLAEVIRGVFVVVFALLVLMVLGTGVWLAIGLVVTALGGMLEYLRGVWRV